MLNVTVKVLPIFLKQLTMDCNERTSLHYHGITGATLPQSTLYQPDTSLRLSKLVSVPTVCILERVHCVTGTKTYCSQCKSSIYNLTS